jgi:hypothetical protein
MYWKHAAVSASKHFREWHRLNFLRFPRTDARLEASCTWIANLPVKSFFQAVYHVIDKQRKTSSIAILEEIVICKREDCYCSERLSNGLEKKQKSIGFRTCRMQSIVKNFRCLKLSTKYIHFQRDPHGTLESH